MSYPTPAPAPDTARPLAALLETIRDHYDDHLAPFVACYHDAARPDRIQPSDHAHVNAIWADYEAAELHLWQRANGICPPTVALPTHCTYCGRAYQAATPTAPIAAQLGREIATADLNRAARQYVAVADQVRDGNATQELLRARQADLLGAALLYAAAAGWTPP